MPSPAQIHAELFPDFEQVFAFGLLYEGKNEYLPGNGGCEEDYEDPDDSVVGFDEGKKIGDYDCENPDVHGTDSDANRRQNIGHVEPGDGPGGDAESDGEGEEGGQDEVLGEVVLRVDCGAGEGEDDEKVAEYH